MLAADRKAGAYYICNPNNPTGTITSQQDIEYLIANKPKGSVVIVDEAYIHFASNMTTARDLVLVGKDVLILRTFSKVYGMAGIRSGFVMTRPDLLEKLAQYGDDNLPIRLNGDRARGVDAAKVGDDAAGGIERKVR